MPIFTSTVAITQPARRTQLDDACDEIPAAAVGSAQQFFVVNAGSDFVSNHYRAHGMIQGRISFTALKPVNSLVDVYLSPCEPIQSNSFSDAVQIPPWGIFLASIAGAGGAGANTLIDFGPGTAHAVGIVDTFTFHILDNFGIGINGFLAVALFAVAPGG